MDQPFAGLGVLFVAGFGPITRESDESKAFYVEALGLPLKPMPGNETYLLSEQGALDGGEAFRPVAAGAGGAVLLWRRSLAGGSRGAAGVDRVRRGRHGGRHRGLVDRGYRLLVANREEPWGQSVTRLLSPEGLLVGVTYTPRLR